MEQATARPLSSSPSSSPSPSPRPARAPAHYPAAARPPAAPRAAAPSAGHSPAVPAPYHRRLGLALILTAAFMVVLDFSIVNVALPSIQRELHFPAATVEWVVTGYAIAFGGLLILGGR